MRLAGIPVADSAVAELAGIVRAAGADALGVRLERAVVAGVRLLALTSDERAIILAVRGCDVGGGRFTIAGLRFFEEGS